MTASKGCLLRPNDTAAAIQRLALTYYDTPDAAVGDLKTVAMQLLNGTSWQTMSTEYYRYYTGNYDGTANSQPGYVQGLKFVVGPEAFARLSQVADPFTAPDSIVARYADVYYEYTDLESGVNSRRVTRAVTGAGTHVHDFSYENAPADQPLGFNNWQLKCTADQADGSQKITFTNYVRQVLLTDLWHTPGDQASGRWVRYTTYDPTCDCPTASYSPAAINMSASPVYNQGVADLTVALNDATGLVKIFTYSGSGPTACYPEYEQVQQGAAGTPINVRQYGYTVQTIGSSPTQTTLVVPASITEFRSDAGGGSDPVTTSFAYTFINTPVDTVQINQRTKTQPQVPTSQNGQGDNPTTDPLYVSVDTFDIQGRLVQTTDPYDSNNPPAYIPSVTFAYDEPTGALIQQVTNPYSGTPPSTSEYNLVTDYLVDDLGRTLQALGPTHNVNGQWVRTALWTVYQDVVYQVWSASGFATGSNNGPSYVLTLVNPVTITRMDHAGRTTDQISAVRATTAGPLTASDYLPQSSSARWTQNCYDDAGDLTAMRVYHDIPADGAGSPGANYDETTYGYDQMGRRNMVRSPGGTITRTVFDVRNNPVAVYVGTADVGATDAAPDGSGAPGNNLVSVQTSVYDGGNPVGGDNLLTTVYQQVDGTSANDRRTDYGYDFRDRQTSTTAYIVTVGTPRSVVMVNTYDNLGRVVQVDQYDTTVAAASRIRESQTLFDNLGRVYQTAVYAVPITGGSAGTPSTPQISNTWFNAQGQPVKSQPAGAATYTKTQYDQVARAAGTFTGYSDGSDDPWSIGASDHLVEQILSGYDPAGNVVQTTTFQRNQGATSATGELTTDNSRVRYTGMWYDETNRPLASADYGTTSFDRSALSTPPDPSDDVLVTTTAYNDRGEVFEATDPGGVVTRTAFDDEGRVVSVIQNYQEQASGSADANIKVDRTYAPDGGLATLTARNPATGDQTTRFLYGTSLTYGNDIARTDILIAEVYPNAVDATDQVSYWYNRQAQRKQMCDPNGTVHQYAFDGLGRTTSDRATTLGAGIDAAVRRIDTEYEIRGMIAQVTSYSDVGGTAVVNEVVMTFNAFEQMVSDAQTAGANPGAVGYGYADGTTNTIRPTSVTYPNGRVLNLEYASGTEDDVLSRVTDLAIGGEATPAVAYHYFGVATVASVIYPMPGGVNVQSTVASGSSYPGLDAFGRVVNLPWTKTSTGDLAQLNYEYDAWSNRRYRQDLLAGAGNAKDETYAYDALQRLNTFRRGALQVDGTDQYHLTSVVFAQDWDLDPTGNWSGFTQFDQASASNGLDQRRVHNSFNEITNISQTVGAAWAAPSYDRNGNSTAIPLAADPLTPYGVAYDAWNRLVAVPTSVGNLLSYQYDGWNRRILQNTYYSGVLVAARYFYYSAQWQVLEERLDGSTEADRQYVWGLRYVDDCVLRDRDTTGGGTLNERLFALQDANWNVIGLSDNTGAIQERYGYDPYGTPLVLAPDWTLRSASAFDWNYLHQGGRFEPNPGLYCFRHRDFSAILGRWLTPDALGIGPADLNVYLYISNNPIKLNDPTGLQSSVPLGLPAYVGHAWSNPIALRLLLQDAANLGLSAIAISEIRNRLNELNAPAGGGAAAVATGISVAQLGVSLFNIGIHFPIVSTLLTVGLAIGAVASGRYDCVTLFGYCVSTYFNQCANCLFKCLSRGSWPVSDCPLTGRNLSETAPPGFVPPR